MGEAVRARDPAPRDEPEDDETKADAAQLDPSVEALAREERLRRAGLPDRPKPRAHESEITEISAEAEAERAKARAAAKVKGEAEAAKAEAEAAKAKADAERAIADQGKAKAEAEKAKHDAERVRAETELRRLQSREARHQLLHERLVQKNSQDALVRRDQTRLWRQIVETTGGGIVVAAGITGMAYGFLLPGFILVGCGAYPLLPVPLRERMIRAIFKSVGAEGGDGG